MRRTCGAYYKEFREHFSCLDLTTEQAICIGFMYGQAEKVFLGACNASMFRPLLERKNWSIDQLKWICALLQLSIVIADRKEIEREIWICKPQSRWLLQETLEREEYNSLAWHIFRGLMTGVPLTEIDNEFHTR